MGSLRTGLQWTLDRLLSVAYGVVYDTIFERFRPYQSLTAEVLKAVETEVPPAVDPRDVRILEVGCGPGNFACALAEAGYTVTGLDAYGALVEVAREKRRARHLTNLAFRQGNLAEGSAFREATFDQVVNVHSLYVQADPDRLLRETWRVLKPGGHAVFVNHTRRLGRWATLAEIARRDGLRTALRCVIWVVPNLLFEAMRRPAGPHYWDEGTFTARLRAAGFAVLETRRTFLDGASLLVRARKSVEG